MYKLIIADDEPKIVSLLCKVINWEELGFEVVCTANDGSDVIGYINKHDADCILSDIRMVEVSGIELAEYVYDNYPKIKVILLSAYQDFSYAVNALKYNVYSYINKPLNVDELISTFFSLKTDLDKTSSDSEFIAYYIRSALCDLIDRKFKSVYDTVPLFKLISGSKMPITDKTGCCVLKIKCFPAWKNNMEDMHNNFLDNIAHLPEYDTVTYFIRNKDNHIEYIIFSNSAEEKQFEENANKIVENLNTFLSASASISECEYHHHLSELYSGTNDAFAANIQNFKKSFIQSVISVSSSEIYEYISILFKLKLPIHDMKDIIMNIISELRGMIKDKAAGDEIFDEFCRKLSQSSDLSEINRMCGEYFVAISEIFSSDDDGNIKSDIIKIRNYIFEHHAEYLSLNDMAGMIHLSPRYFSKKFKEIVGETFSDFIISCRMNHAKELLIKTDKKISSISTLVGYNNPNFFATLFKKYYNIPPSKYRDKFSDNGGNSFE